MSTFYGTLIFCILIVGITTEYSAGHNGRPHCKTDIEMKIFYWSNNNDPTLYWICKEPHVPGVLMHCPSGKAFTKRYGNCVGWDEWEWEEPKDPPSMAW